MALVDISNSILTGEVKADCVVCDAILLYSFSLSPKKEIRDDVAVKGGVEEGNGYCSRRSRRGLVQEDKRMAFVYTHGLFIT